MATVKKKRKGFRSDTIQSVFGILLIFILFAVFYLLPLEPATCIGVVRGKVIKHFNYPGIRSSQWSYDVEIPNGLRVTVIDYGINKVPVGSALPVAVYRKVLTRSKSYALAEQCSSRA